MCKRSHHRLLHINTSPESRSPQDPSITAGQVTNEAQSPKPAIGLHTSLITSSGLLATARIIIQSPSGEKLEVRALIAPCAERSFISKQILQSLSLENHKVSQDVCFLGGKSRITVKIEAKLIRQAHKKKTAAKSLALNFLKLYLIIPFINFYFQYLKFNTLFSIDRLFLIRLFFFFFFF